MKTTGRLGYGLTLLALIGLWGAAQPARAQQVTATFTNTFGNGVWEHDAHIGLIGNPNDPSVAGNWSTQAYPTNHHHIVDPNTGINIPGNDPFYDVVLSLNGCSLGASVSVQTVSVVNAITLDIVPGGNLRIAGAAGITDNGTILVNPNAVNTSTGIQFVADSQIGGAGNVMLNGVPALRSAAE